MAMAQELYNTKHVGTLHDVSGETVRAWAMEFQEYLSPSANPGRRRQRLYTPEDMAVLALVAAMKSTGSTYEDIHVSLKAGQRGSTPGTPPNDLQAMITTDNRRALAAENEQLKRRIETLNQHLATYREAEIENARLQGEMTGKMNAAIERAERAEKSLGELQAEQATLHEQIGQLKAKIEQLGEEH